jgi:proteasome beta subunit
MTFSATRPGGADGGTVAGNSVGTGDFSELLRLSGGSPTLAEAFRSSSHGLSPAATGAAALHVEATTVLAFHYKDGVLIAGDRRATAGNMIMYDRADKVIELDQDTIIAIAGSPAVAFEMARTLQTSFQYYRRSQLQALTMNAKVRALGKLIKDNLPMTMQGVGAVVPILTARDAQHQLDPTIYFYDALGAQFLSADFSVSGSGSGAPRSILQWINRWSGQPTAERDEKSAIQLALQLLDVAAESDSATGGVDRRSHVFPQIKLLTRGGLRSLSMEETRECFTALEAIQK